MARLIILCCLLLSPLLVAQTSERADLLQEKNKQPSELDQPLSNGFELLRDLPTKNQIPMFENRFRIDENVEEITLLLFRRRGSASTVLVRPDGSKIHFQTAEAQKVRWHDASSYDLIEIKNPTPGPWQAVGKLLPESRIMVLTDIKLNVDPLPSNLMVGETIKITARLTNANQPINVKDFRDVLALEMIFVSTNNADYDNFGRGVVQVAQFRDDGKGYDERARDGVFTGEFQLRFIAGEWTPKYIVRTPLYTREVEQTPVILKAAPITADITAAVAADETTPEQQVKPHQIVFRVTDDSVNKATVLLQGRIRYPNGDVEEFALNEPNVTPRTLELRNRGHGSYILDVSAFGTMQDGREFAITLPEISFVVNRPVFEAPALDDLPQKIKDEIAAEQAGPEAEFPWGLVIIVNLLTLVGGSFAIWFVMSDKKIADLLFWRKKPVDVAISSATNKAEDSNVTKNSNNVQKNNDMDDILDLTLPDD
ncbi:TIGR03503 family protein [Rheinheimera sp. D18]|uniref:TIGR03503 family protein n=1 Tax=Rheinheimera sp. D18 TaxID=2545632 RepID=UPI001048F6F3|nr:TIGR03503 family protein [Rheinheimera sp. D18]QBL08796.1 TIGR03503 family protein [Rheinheimera sp. D18]